MRELATTAPNETSHNVEMIYDLLQTVEPINFQTFFVNPTSFAQTVENLFYIAFLVRDGKVSISEIEGDLVIGGLVG